MIENKNSMPQPEVKQKLNLPIVQSIKKSYSNNSSPIKRVFFLILGILALTGILDNILLFFGWGNVFNATEEILNASMKSAATNTLLLALIKGTLGFMSSLEGGVVVVSANIGAFFSGFSDLIDMAFNFFLSVSGLIATMIATIKIIELTGISIFAGVAFILFSFDPNLKTVVVK